MFKPNDIPAKNIDPLVLLNIWAHHLDHENASGLNEPIIFAGLGKPSYLLNEDLALSATNYWQELLHNISKTTQILTHGEFSSEEICDKIAHASSAIDYGVPAGNLEATNLMAQALTKWYGLKIEAKEVIFTVGGLSALKILFQIINRKKEKGKIVTPLPYYPFYNNPFHSNNLHFIDLMNEPGYRLTATSLRKSLQAARDYTGNEKISAFLFCDPNNPLGFVVGEKEWKEIAEILKTTSDDIPIILDEAYAELVFHKEHISLLKSAPELKNRIIVIRSATKGFSASGERMAVTICFNEEWREDFLNELSLTYLHPPTSLQFAYANAMFNFTNEKKEKLSNHYQIQTAFVQKRLKELDIELSDQAYTIEGTFYALANLKKLFGTKIPSAASQALGKDGIISTDVELCYSLLFRDRIMIAPLSFFGGDPTLGFVRITCSSGIASLKKLLDRIEYRLNETRG